MSHSNSNLVAVVMRQLKNHRPAVSKVIQQSEDKTVDDQIHYLTTKADEHIDEFKKGFVEYRNADWYIDIINTNTDKVISTTHYF